MQTGTQYVDPESRAIAVSVNYGIGRLILRFGQAVHGGDDDLICICVFVAGATFVMRSGVLRLPEKR